MQKIDILHKKADIINKKALILLAVAGGTGAYTIKFFTEDNNFFGYAFLVILTISSLGAFINYVKLSRIEKEIERLEDNV